ncbi:hypothetical protein [Actinomadura madurae]|uniref:hypothetical protein n=1 Tax=Actinomadura madurae TaxID=1993 RepID=UPI001160396F|nr:hypothetical protein [Actinomadura madurae]MCQ0008422.1 hypothetical protein [Actinomadura madurae]URN07052.1 hypothetical protein LUW74_29475 [Actinomadura madurae]
MSEGSRPEFVAPEQQLDGSERPVEEQAAEAPAPPPRDARRWSRLTHRRWVLGAVALALVAGGGAFWALGGPSGESEAGRFTSMPEPCSLVPGETLERYVPNSEPPVPSEARNSADARYEACEWAEPMGAAGSAETLTSHRLNVAVRLHLDGTEPAKSEYDAAWGGARSMAGTADGAAGALHAEAPVTMGIGDQAFAQHLTLSGSLGRSGSVAATVRLRNAVISVRYRGTTSPAGVDGAPKAGKTAPLDEAEARAGAEAVARGIAGTLAACKDCVSR